MAETLEIEDTTQQIKQDAYDEHMSQPELAIGMDENEEKKPIKQKRAKRVKCEMCKRFMLAKKLSEYNLYMQKHVKQIKESDPSVKPKDRFSKVAEMWKQSKVN